MFILASVPRLAEIWENGIWMPHNRSIKQRRAAQKKTKKEKSKDNRKGARLIALSQ